MQRRRCSVIFYYHRCFFRKHKKDSGLLRRVILIFIVQKFNAQHQCYNKQDFYNNIQYSVGTGTRSKNKIHVYGVMGMCSRSASVHGSGAGCQDKRYTGNYHIYCFFQHDIIVLRYIGAVNEQRIPAQMHLSCFCRNTLQLETYPDTAVSGSIRRRLRCYRNSCVNISGKVTCPRLCDGPYRVAAGRNTGRNE